MFDWLRQLSARERTTMLGRFAADRWMRCPRPGAADGLPDATTRQRVLVDNPARLYGLPVA